MRCRLCFRLRIVIVPVGKPKRCLYAQALIDGVVAGTPCVLNQSVLGKSRDKDPEWRPTAIYTRDELLALISDSRIPEDRRPTNAFAGLAGLRMGEVAGLRWGDIDRSLGNSQVARAAVCC